ncbi:hypothetical protein [Yinghuangia soli]|uniref:Uncharacterized protein n=1 Tax=Yinghuangia soli TaxID=2908204 RepID=A0AA41Q6J7_9ACTN|nr:hypothetical protein [Yinghuangia soli]MCF2532503.1 hypothetical protein [Yinghuangia soli]
MTEERRTLTEPATEADSQQVATWLPRRGDLAYDTALQRIGVVIAIPEDTGADLYHLRPEVGGDWAASAANLSPPIGCILNTIYGRQRVMDLLDPPHGRPTLYLRPERGGTEWTVLATELHRVIRP